MLNVSAMIRKIASKYLLFFLAITSGFATYAQPFEYLSNQPGKFIFDNRLDKIPGVDMSTVQKKLTSIVEWVRQNDSVIDSPIGFDAVVCFGNFNPIITPNDDFGILTSVGFSFNHYYLDNGVLKRATGNTAHGTEIFINNPINTISNRLDEAEFKTEDPPHLKKALEKARENLREYYIIAPVIEEIAPGVRLYASGGWFKGVILVFNPDRPEIWIPVTVREIMEVKLAYYKVKHEIDSIIYEKMVAEWAKMNFNPDPEHTMRPQLYQRIKQEYENFTAEELNSPAYSCSSEECGISTINARGDGRAVARFNPACWDRSLPVTAVQFMSLEYRPATEQELDEFKPRNRGLEDFVGKFFNKLPVEKMGVLIDRK